MAQRWKGREEGLRESVRIAEECTGFTLDWMRPPLPDFRKAKLGAGLADVDDNHALRRGRIRRSARAVGRASRRSRSSRSSTSSS